jgi:TolA-binding protein
MEIILKKELNRERGENSAESSEVLAAPLAARLFRRAGPPAKNAASPRCGSLRLCGKNYSLSLLIGLLLVFAGCASVPIVDKATAARAFEKGKSLYLQGDYTAARVKFQTYRGGQAEPARLAEGCYWEGMCLLAQREFEAARDKFKQGLKKKPGGWTETYVLCGLGESLMGLGQFEAAQEAYESALETSQVDIRLDHVLLRLATCGQRRGNWAEADSYLNRLLAELPESPLADQAKEKLQYGKRRFFTVQVGAFRTAEAARKRAGELKRQKLKPDPFVGQIERGGQKLYCVWLGRFDSWLEATLAMQRVRGQGQVENAIVKP